MKVKIEPIKSKIKNDLNSAKMHFWSKFGDSSLNS